MRWDVELWLPKTIWSNYIFPNMTIFPYCIKLYFVIHHHGTEASDAESLHTVILGD
jgi:hypothetical protein